MMKNNDSFFPTKERNTTSPNKLKCESEEKEEFILGIYKLGKTIGEGTFGKVKLATHKITGEKVTYNILIIIN